jgi:hypothetical protein
MGDIGHGYGSEWHLLRWLGRHRADLTRRVIRVFRDAEAVEWLDFHFDPGKKPWYDAEWESLDFLTTESAVRAAWHEFWPHGCAFRLSRSVRSEHRDHADRRIMIGAERR